MSSQRRVRGTLGGRTGPHHPLRPRPPDLTSATSPASIGSILEGSQSGDEAGAGGDLVGCPEEAQVLILGLSMMSHPQELRALADPEGARTT